MTKQNGKTASRNIDPEKYPIEVFGNWVVMIFEKSSSKSVIIMPAIVAEKKHIAKVVAVGPDADIALLGKNVFFNYVKPFTEMTYGDQKYMVVPNEDMQGAFGDR